MAAYLIARMEVLDPIAFEPYVMETPAIVAKYGGEYLVNAGRCEWVEGQGPKRHVVIEFDNMLAARAFYDSAEFRRVLPLAKKYTKRDLVLVEGV